MDKNLSTIENKKLSRLDKQINRAKENKKLFIHEISELKSEKAIILCPFSIGDEVIRSDGRRGKVSKIKLDANSNAVFSVFLQNKHAKEFAYNFGEHYRTKADEVWVLVH